VRRWEFDLHCKAVVHETESRGPDDGANVFRNGRRLVEGAELVDCADGFFFTPWSAACEHLQDYAAERPDVDFGAVALVVYLRSVHIRAARGYVQRLTLRTDDLWCHPEDGSLHAVGDVVDVRVSGAFRDSEIRYLAGSVEVEQDVVGFEITVEDTLAVKVGETAESLASK
jgi:hypothetical protein